MDGLYVVYINWDADLHLQSPPIGPLPYAEARKLATKIRKRLWANGFKRRPFQVTISTVRDPDSIWGWEGLQ